MKWRRRISLRKRWAKNHLITKNGSDCSICKRPFNTKKQITIDHIQPLSKGGVDDIENMQLAHYRCNRLKRNMTPEEFEEYQNG